MKKKYLSLLMAAVMLLTILGAETLSASAAASDAGIGAPSGAALTEDGALLVCDEVIDGFRFAYGTYSSVYAGVTPDLVTLGKVIGGGLPVSRSVMARAMREGPYIETGPDDRLPDLLHQKNDRSRDKCQKIRRKVMGQGHKRSGDILVKLCNGKEFRINSAETELTVCGSPDGKKGEQK